MAGAEKRKASNPGVATMEKESSPSVSVAEVTGKVEAKLIPIFIMGKRYMVPNSFTIMKAMEYAGYKFVRGCGCRGGVCGACATVYRKAGDYKIYTGLACQTVIEPNIYLAQIPFYPANRASYDYSKLKGTPEEINKLYPELFRCVACNACTKVCPMDVQVMDVISYIKQGNIEKAAHASFDCIQCGLCASRCFAEMPQYHIMQLVRRIYGGKLTPRAKHLEEMVEEIEGGKYEQSLRQLMETGEDKLKELYVKREVEPEEADESWTPASAEYL